jgi:hypothetical protein
MRAAFEIDEAEDRAQERRLSGRVRAEQGHDLALIDVERNAVERADRAETNVDGLPRLFG